MSKLTGWSMNTVRQHSLRDLRAYLEYEQQQSRARRMASKRRKT